MSKTAKCYCIVLLPYLLRRESSYRCSSAITLTWCVSILEVPSPSVKSTHAEIQLVEAAAFQSALGFPRWRGGNGHGRVKEGAYQGLRVAGHGKLELHHFWFSTDGRSRQTSLEQDMPVSEREFLTALSEWNSRNYYRLPGSFSFTLLLLLSCTEWNLEWPSWKIQNVFLKKPIG